MQEQIFLKNLGNRIRTDIFGAASKHLDGSTNGFSDVMDRLDEFKDLQRLAFSCCREISSLITEGWTEIQASRLMEQWLNDHGVNRYFHKPFVWWGDRTRFRGVKNYKDYQPTSRRIVANEVYILDVAPIMGGIVCDVGYTNVLGEHPEFENARKYLLDLRERMIQKIEGSLSASDLYSFVDRDIVEHGFENIHKTYPFGVLAHRLRPIKEGLSAQFLHFGWQSYWDYLSRGLFGQILNQDYRGSIEGVWAIEPHVGGADFGAKFEEILVVSKDRTYWLEKNSWL